MLFKKNKAKTLAQTSLHQKNYQSILLALFAVLIPHFFYMPVSLSLLMAAILVIWQVLLYRKGNFRQVQSRWLQYTVVIVGLGIIFLQYKTFFGVEAGCAALALILLGKAFEVKNYRDAIIQLNFALFVVASLFLYGQGLILAVAALIGVFACFYGMYQLQSYHTAYEEVLIQDVSSKQLRQQAFKTVGKLLLIAMPIMVVLFLFFPRLPPLWSMPTSNQQAKTGVSDEISPGDIARLSQSSELAFRVIFPMPHSMPPKSQLYWRAMVLEDFNGLKWTQNDRNKYAAFVQQKDLSNPKSILPVWYQLPDRTQRFQAIDYQMIIEPTFQNWTYALDYSIAAQPLQLKPDLSIQLPFPLTRRRQFEFKLLQPNPVANFEISEELRKRNLALPAQANPQTKAFSEQLWHQSGENPQRYAQRILNWIGQENFSYTLSPPLLNGDRIDDFLFRTHAGFCEHYASAFVNLMRMAGIPARVVVGYQGGQAAPDGQTWEVRQLDAHAWTEVWFKDQGWVRIDPTAAIAAERIEQGMQNYAQNSSLFGDAHFNRLQSQWLTQARIWADYVNYQWQSKVVGFDQNKQRNWLQRFSIENLSQQLMLLLLAIISIIGTVIWYLSRSQRVPQSKLDRALQQLSKRLNHVKLQRLENEPVLSWLKRIQQHSGVDERLTKIMQLYTQHTYINNLSKAELKQLIDLIGKYTFA
ncbi:MAG: DUF3488 and transglutaminase-like domain-containing protein [Acinetobacter populi]|uniref:transglutaminase family protein n=1 Tax=Acinetobacter populi TaxID=1582270 RepID=UPI002356FAEC|nr:DUF3488 and transglutaminase-like domain-containing protein [Acinetobacter populi]MCH4247259.1 DUF3488 and transglutaminase-like domain-containing protein [Acinetobacter populi]